MLISICHAAETKTGHKDFEHQKDNASGFLESVTSEKRAALYVCPGFHEFLFHCYTLKIFLAKKQVVEDFFITPNSLLVGYVYTQHAGAEWRTHLACSITSRSLYNTSSYCISLVWRLGAACPPKQTVKTTMIYMPVRLRYKTGLVATRMIHTSYVELPFLMTSTSHLMHWIVLALTDFWFNHCCLPHSCNSKLFFN